MKLINKNIGQYKFVIQNLYEIISVIVLGYLFYFFMFMLTGTSILSHSDYDSYTRQALLWLDGKTGLEENITWLELAIFNGKYYISFPPVPTLFILPLAAIFGNDTPNTLLISLYGLLSYYLVFCYARYIKHKTYYQSLFWAVFIVFGCNILYLSLEGSVWYQAQVLCFLLSICAIFCLSVNREALNYIGVLCWALSVGCRPFNAIYLPIIVILLARSQGIDRTYPILSLVKRLWKYAIPAVVVFGLMLYYNWLRFGNMFVFGHSYLPANLNSTYGQFSFKYIWLNLRNSFDFPEFINGRLHFDQTDSNFLLLVNPIYILFIYMIFKKNLRSANYYLMAGLVLFNALLLYSHNCMGAFQFGFRYFVDMIPWIAFAILNTDMKISQPVILLAAYSVLINIYGAVWLYLEWYKV